MGKIKEHYHDKIESGMKQEKRINVYLQPDDRERAKSLMKARGITTLSGLIRNLITLAYQKEKKDSVKK